MTFPCDQGDILQDFIEWHLHLGVDLIVAEDCGSTDGSTELLDQYSKSGRLTWHTLPDRDMSRYSAHAVAELARDRYGADWLVHCDVDEFLCTRGADLRTVLGSADRSGVTTLNLRRHSMTGSPLGLGQRATQALTLRVDRPRTPTEEQKISGELPVPFIFIDVPGRPIVRASALATYGDGWHTVETTWGANAISEQLYILHYPLREFETLRTKVRNAAAWFEDNRQLEPWWGWHWRRWVRLEAQNRLREDYDKQFTSPAQARELVREGICEVDDSVARWITPKQRKMTGPRVPTRIRQLLAEATHERFRNLFGG
jgi:hypothetical protein